MESNQGSYPTVIDKILVLSKELLILMEEKLGTPPPLLYLSTGYIGPDKFMSDTTDIDTNLRRCKAIIQSSVPAVIEIINSYIALEGDKAKMTKGVFPRARVTCPEWSGGSFYDALKILGETEAYDVVMMNQNELLHMIGIERYYDLEGHDNTVDVLKLTKKILLYQSSPTTARDET